MLQRDNINLIWASLLVEECLRNGADTFFVAPGSRCTPLTLAVARHPEARAVRHMDERGLGFAALGFARATGRPGVIICTSGTAVSNLTPAVVEAHMDAQPMLLLTADRPFELRQCGANQSIPQVNAFAPYVRHAMDLAAPDTSVPPSVVLTTVDDALRAAADGPVHLNCPFREPLAALPDRTDDETYLIPVHDWMKGHDPYTTVLTGERSLDELALTGLPELVDHAKRVLVIMGGGCRESDALSVEQLAVKREWPVVSDVHSGLHFGPQRNTVVRHVDALVGASGFPQDLEPDLVLQFGTRFLSKPLLQALQTTQLDAWIQVSAQEGRFDPVHRVTHRIVSDSDRFCLQLQSSEQPQRPNSPWKLAWLEADHSVEKVFREELDGTSQLSEPAVARYITRRIRELHGLVLGASMPVRDANQFSARNAARIHVACNRGASGIDGTLATAVGYARGLHQTVTVLLGDLAALHDLNSLAMVAGSRDPLIVVVVNNRGGGIFHFLPQVEDDDFETWFGTPHQWDFEHAAGQFDLPYALVKEMEDFEAAYEEALDNRRSCLIEVQTDRKDNLLLHRRLEAKRPLGTEKL